MDGPESDQKQRVTESDTALPGRDHECVPCAPTDLPAWYQFLDRNFEYEPPESYAVDFAPLFEPAALKYSRLIRAEGVIVASATLYPMTAVTPQGKLRLGVVGAVATELAYRGRGYSSRVLADIERIASGRVDALVLWSDQRDFYSKLGYQAAGKQEILSLEKLPAPAVLAAGYPIYGWDEEQVRTMYQAHSLRIDRSDAHWKAMEKITSCARVCWVTDTGKALAYVGFDRGRDMRGIIHEWGGEPRALHSLVWTLLQSRPELQWLTHPRLTDPIRARLLAAGVSPVELNLAMLKALPGPGGATPASGPVDWDSIWFWGLDSL